MSAGYASRLSEYENKGICGLPEKNETKRSFILKMRQLAKMVKDAKHLVVLTGAGISTSAGIPDFRGPRGIWTLEEKKKKKEEEEAKEAEKSGHVPKSGDKYGKKGKKRKRKELNDTNGNEAPKMDFREAKPTMTHRAIRKLVELGYVKFVVTQNVDGLHKRSGLSRDHHAVLHGCVFTETCEKCDTEHFRDYDVGGMSFQRTGRKCEECNGHLVDSLLDWEDALPEFDFDRAGLHFEQADLAIALGTSLRIEPAGGLPARAQKYIIVNLQVTPYDKDAKLILRAPVDDVMNELLMQLGHPNWDDGGESIEIERLWKRPPPIS